MATHEVRPRQFVQINLVRTRNFEHLGQRPRQKAPLHTWVRESPKRAFPTFSSTQEETALRLRHAPAAGLSALGLLIAGPSAFSQETPTAYIGEIAITAGPFCPRGWLETNGQILPASQNTTLRALLGCTFGGDCRSTFAVPDLRGRSVLGTGTSPRGIQYLWGNTGGAESVRLHALNFPPHIHDIAATATPASDPSPTEHFLGEFGLAMINGYSNQPPNPDIVMAEDAIGITGAINPAPIDLRQPGLGLVHCIATTGVFPPRN